MINRSKSFIDYLSILVFASIFIFIFIQNFVLSDSWAVLSLREIDDFAMQSSVRRLQLHLLNGDWFTVLTFNDYAYGTGFWILNALLLLPFYWIDNPQWTIVAGRDISLIFGFCCVYLVGQISERIYNDKFFKNLIMLSVITMPIMGMWTMRLHVNTQFTAFGLISLYLLIRQPKLEHNHLVWSAIFAGLSLGFKLTGIFIMPILIPVLYFQLKNQQEPRLLRSLIKYFLILGVFTIGSARTLLLVLPFYPDQLMSFIETVNTFRKLGTPANDVLPTPLSLLQSGIGAFYFNLWIVSALFLLNLKLSYEGLKRKNYLSTLILFGIIIGILALTFIVRKGGVYSAAYLMGIGILMPLGLLGLATLKWPKILVYNIALILMVTEFFINSGPRTSIFNKYYLKNSDPKIQIQIQALNEISALIPPHSEPIRFLMDCTAVFPRTSFNPGTFQEFNYWNLESKKTEDYDYIVLNTKGWMPSEWEAIPIDHDKIYDSLEGLTGIDLEMATRQKLKIKNDFYGKKYELIYSKNNIELYRRIR